MKPGDLVRWTYNDDPGVGIVLSVGRLPNEYNDGEVLILWSPSSGTPDGHRGVYPARHRYMEEVHSEDR